MPRPSRPLALRRVSTAAIAVLLAARASAEPMPSPFDALAADAARAAGGYQWVYLAGAAAATLALSPTGGDHAIRLGVQRHLRAPAYGDAAYFGGYVLPVLLPASLYVTGLLGDEREMAGAGSAALQALAFTEVVTVVLKAGTGRPFPLHGGDPHAPDRLEHPEYAREFSPFAFAGRYAWPSGHTAAAISVAAALTAYYDGSWLVPAIAYPVAGAIGFGMIVGDRHWGSDVLAGALVGQGIGWSVGESFAERRRAHPGERATVHVVPLLSWDQRGLAVAGLF